MCAGIAPSDSRIKFTERDEFQQEKLFVLITVFPAGILQPLFYSQNFPKSLNYGGIGVVIGHGKHIYQHPATGINDRTNFISHKTEITHGFDDKGRQFDLVGNMKQWWNNATIKNFRERAQCIIDQYSRYRIDEVGLYMNGRMTQGENIAVRHTLNFL